MESRFLNKEIIYDGSQLRSHWIFEQTGILGDCIVSFLGPADVPLKNMVDLVDVAVKENIYSTSMLHFIAEHFEVDLDAAILKQRLLVAIAAEEFLKFDQCSHVERRGDDLYDGDKKLSVSIATISQVSSLIHFGINIRSDKTPIITKGLIDFSIDTKEFATRILQKYIEDIKSMRVARCKVRSVI